MTYVGELGWELIVPVEPTPAPSTTPLRDARRRPRLADAGYYAIESLRLEKGYRAFGRELTPDFTPVEAGLRLRHGARRGRTKDFLGRDALAAHRERLRAPAARGGGWCPSCVDDPDADAVGRRAGAARRRARSARSPARPRARPSAPASAWPTCGRDEPVTSDWLADGGFEVDVGGERLPITATLKAPLA